MSVKPNFRNVGRSPAPLQSPIHAGGSITAAWARWASGVDVAVGLGYSVVPLVTVSGTLTATPAPQYGIYQEIDATGNVTVEAPAAGGGLGLVLILVQDSTGGRTFTLDPIYRGVPTLSTAANTYTALAFVLRPDGKYMLVSSASGTY
jgi:hypothetical protein